MHSTLSEGMFLLHIKAEMVPTGNVSHKTKPFTLYRTFLLHIQAEMVPTLNISHKTMHSTLSAGCFSYTSRLK